jgi:murein DD-endopeptidase MepM/ murein hydrolase activator NlpD
VLALVAFAASGASVGLADESPDIEASTGTPYFGALASASAEAEPLHRAVVASLRGWHPGEVPQQAMLVWPVSGYISSRFTPAHPLGIDIGLIRTPNAPILAAAAGKVVFAGGDRCCSYGLHVILEHGNGFSTVYAHLSRIEVKEGDTVKSGFPLGLGGTTGKSSSEHLHFELRRGDEWLDPMPYLPPHTYVEPVEGELISE